MNRPTITSDRIDYSPGSVVTLTGTGWAPGEAVHIFVNDDIGQTWSYSTDVTADTNGAFTNQFTLPNWSVATYSVTATGTRSGTALTSFTDTPNLVKVDLANSTSSYLDWQKFSSLNCGSGSAITGA